MKAPVTPTCAIADSSLRTLQLHGGSGGTVVARDTRPVLRVGHGRRGGAVGGAALAVESSVTVARGRAVSLAETVSAHGTVRALSHDVHAGLVVVGPGRARHWRHARRAVIPWGITHVQR
jgi:hypothetical protein